MSQSITDNTPAITQFLEENSITKLDGRDQLIALAQKVAQIPWGEGRTIEEVLETKKIGTCTGKHLLLKACLDHLSIPNRITVCTFRWSEQGLPITDELKSILNEGEWTVHGCPINCLHAATISQKDALRTEDVYFAKFHD